MTIERGFYFSAKARRSLRNAIYYEKLFRYPDCITQSQDAIEFSGKAILEFFDIGYEKEHYLGEDFEKKLGKKNEPFVKKSIDEIARAIVISDHWLQQSRNLSKYGFMHLGLSPIKAFHEEEAKLAIKDSTEFVKFLNKAELYKKFKYPLKIGILNGFVRTEGQETRCNKIPDMLRINEWITYLSSLETPERNRKYIISEIKASEINNEFALIINPFSECYPELDTEEKFIFNIIEDYVMNGGNFLCLDGFPFFYAWNVNKTDNNMIPLVDGQTQVILPNRIVFNNAVFESREHNMKIIFPFSGTPFWKRFKGKTSSDTTGHEGAQSLPTHQIQIDTERFGAISNIGGNINVDEFRAITSETKDVVPIIRADRNGVEVFPIAAKKHWDGYLISCGMKINHESDKAKIFEATDKFLSWIYRENNPSTTTVN